MLKCLRYKMTVHLFTKAAKLIGNGNLKDFKKGLRYLGIMCFMVPPSDDLCEWFKGMGLDEEELHQIELES